VKATLLLATHAEVREGLLFIAGGGWSICDPEDNDISIALRIEVPWTRTNEELPVVLELLDADGRLVLDEEGEPLLRIDGSLTLGRPAWLKPGSSISECLAFKCGFLPLEPDSCYVVQLTLAEETRDDWRAVFMTAPASEEYE
jgi:hypothetical protein